jgi:mediator of RNA polymerase II transcription subunit 13
MQDVCRNYHELSVLAHSRWLKANPILPFHLGALEIIDRALSGSLSIEA